MSTLHTHAEDAHAGEHEQLQVNMRASMVAGSVPMLPLLILQQWICKLQAHTATATKIEHGAAETVNGKYAESWKHCLGEEEV